MTVIANRVYQQQSGLVAPADVLLAVETARIREPFGVDIDLGALLPG